MKEDRADAPAPAPAARRPNIGGAQSRQAILSGPIVKVMSQLAWPVFVRSSLGMIGPLLAMFWMGRLVGTVGVALVLIQATVQHTVQLYKEETKW